MSLIRHKRAFVDRVEEHRLNPESITLSKDDQQRLEVVAYMHDLLSDARSMKQIIAKLRGKYPEYGVSRAKAERLYSECIQLFGSRDFDKEYYRGLVLEWQKKAYQIADIRKDVKGMNGAIRNIIKLLGLDKVTPDLPDHNKLLNQVFIMQVSMGENSIPIDLEKPDELPEHVKEALLNAQYLDYENIEE